MLVPLTKVQSLSGGNRKVFTCVKSGPYDHVVFARNNVATCNNILSYDFEFYVS